MAFFRTHPLEIDGYKESRKRITRKDVCYFVAETNRDQEVLFITHVSYIMFWRKLTILSLALIYHIQNFSRRATSIVRRICIQESWTSAQHLQSISSFRFVFSSFLLKCCGWLTLENDRPFSEVFHYFFSVSGSFLPGAGVSSFCAPCWFGPCPFYP